MLAELASQLTACPTNLASVANAGFIAIGGCGVVPSVCEEVATVYDRSRQEGSESHKEESIIQHS